MSVAISIVQGVSAYLSSIDDQQLLLHNPIPSTKEVSIRRIHLISSLNLSIQSTKRIHQLVMHFSPCPISQASWGSPRPTSSITWFHQLLPPRWQITPFTNHNEFPICDPTLKDRNPHQKRKSTSTTSDLHRTSPPHFTSRETAVCIHPPCRGSGFYLDVLTTYFLSLSWAIVFSHPSICDPPREDHQQG